VAEIGTVKQQDIVINRGSKLEMTVDVSNWPDQTNWTARMQMRPNKGSSVLYDEFTTAGAGHELSIVAGANPQVLVDVHGSVTATYDWFNGAYDLFLYDSTGEPHMILQGTVRVNHSVTV
jgi:hypothetical protein